MTTEKIPLEEAAVRLGSTPLNVLMHIKRDLLTGEEVDGRWWVDGVSLEKFLASREDATTTNVCQSSCSHNCPSCG